MSKVLVVKEMRVNVERMGVKEKGEIIVDECLVWSIFNIVIVVIGNVEEMM